MNISFHLVSVAPMGHELALAWEDGVEQYLPLKALRMGCPCAACEGEPDVMGNKIVFQKQLQSESFILKKYEFVGGYALQFYWGDGHHSGIYSFQYLRKLLTSNA